MRQQIVDILDSHLELIESAKYFQWLGRPLDDEEFPAIIMKDYDSVLDEDSGHTLRIEISVIHSGKVSDDVARETRILMEIVSFKFRSALKEMCFHGRLRKTKLDAESSEYQYIQGVMLFEIDYTADEWSV